MSMIKKINADLSDNCVFLYIKIKNKLLNAPKKITILQIKKLKSKLKKKYTKLTENN